MALSSNAWATNYCQDASILECYPTQEGSGTTLTDNSSNGRNGTISSSGLWATAAPSRSYLTQSLNFASNGNNVNLGTSDNKTMAPSQNWSFVAWVFPTVDIIGGGDPRITDRGTSGPQMVVTSAITLDMVGSTHLQRQASNNLITLNAWNHIVVTSDGSATASNTHIYINGSEASSYSNTINGVTLTDVSGSTLFIGNRSDGTRPLTGKMTEIAYFSRILSSSEASDIYNNGLLQAASAVASGPTIINGATLRGFKH